MDKKTGIILGIIILLLVVWNATKTPSKDSTQLTAEERKRVMARVKSLWSKLIKYYAGLYMLPEKRITAIIAQESGGNPNAKGRAGEIGLMQITPGAIADVDKNLQVNKTILDIQTMKSKSLWDYLTGDIFADTRINYFEPAVNLQYGCAYMSLLKDRFGSLDEATKRYNGTGPAADAYLKSVKEFESQY